LFAILEQRFRTAALHWAYDFLADWHLAEDAVQEALLAAYQNLGQLREPAAFPGWFQRIVRSQCHRVGRRHRLQTERPDPDPRCSTTDNRRAELARELVHCLEYLPQHEYVALRLFYWEGCSYQEISQRLNLPLSTVKKRLYSARQRLKGM
jgi:RNA polymerase sigma factor (sigma-70 family)